MNERTVTSASILRFESFLLCRSAKAVFLGQVSVWDLHDIANKEKGGGNSPSLRYDSCCFNYHLLRDLE
jgi:hypothetical protein